MACAFVSACGVEQGEEQFGTGSYEANVISQLDATVHGLADKGLQLHLVGYTPSVPLDSDAAVDTTKAQILDATALVPQYDGLDASSFALNTIAQRMQMHMADSNEPDVTANIQSMAFPGIKVGQKALDVTWESQGHQFQSKLVYDENGVVYDNMLSNIAVVEPGDAPEEKLVGPPAPADTAGQPGGVTAFANASFDRRIVDVTIKWVFGRTRGRVTIDHYVISCDGWRTFCDDGFTETDWMTLGKTTAQAHRNALRKPRISKLAWGYGWATPTAHFNVTFHSGSLTFSASSGGLGSSGHGSGIHTIF